MKIVERYGRGYRMITGRGVWAVLFPARLLLAGVYGLCVAARGRGRTSRERKSLPNAGRVRPTIVSIGNMEAGGGGKTPFAIAVARGIAERGGLPVVVTRGYRGTARKRAPCVVPAARAKLSARGPGFVTGEDLLGPGGDGRRTLAREAEALGDEVLIYRDRGISVVIDPRRGRGIELARRLFSPSHILLDDAFQNFSVEKDVDILLLDAEKPFGGGTLLPLGTLRERAGGARRADIVIFTRAREQRIPEAARRHAEGKPVFFADHEPSGLVGRSGESIPLASLSGMECVLFSGIARPGSFEETILALGAKPRFAFRFVDHHRYVPEDVRLMTDEGGAGAVFVTTEKDRAKAIDLFPAGTAVLALRVDMRIDRLNDLLDLLSTSSS
jgi:tetraacyldisaccharide 4'-kinase